MTTIDFPSQCADSEAQRYADLIAIVSPYLDLEKGPWVAGGAVMRLLRHALHGVPTDYGGDVDIFFASEEQRDALVPLMSAAVNNHGGGEYNFSMATDIRKTSATPHLEKYFRNPAQGEPMDFQIIGALFFPTLGELLDDFDFSVVRMATDGKKIIATDEALADLASGILRTGAATNRVMRPERLVRYMNRGFQPTPETVSILRNIGSMGGGATIYYAAEGQIRCCDDRWIFDYVDRHTMTLAALTPVYMIETPKGWVAFVFGVPMTVRAAHALILRESSNFNDIVKSLREGWTALGLPSTERIYHDGGWATLDNFFDAI